MKIRGSRCVEIVVDPEQPSEIAKAIEGILAHPGEAESRGRNGRMSAELRYNWSTEEEKLKAVYRRLECV